MKVLQVIDTLKVGGAERVLVTLSNLLYKKGVEVSVLILVEDGVLVKELESNIRVYRLERNRRFEKNKMKIFSEIIKGFDIIHTHLKHNYRYTSIVSKRFKLSSQKFIFHDHSHILGVSKLSKKYIKDFLFKNVLKPPYYIGVSAGNCDWAKSYLKVRKENCYLLENIVEKNKKNKPDIKREGIVIVSNITPIKNLEFAIEIVKKLKEKVTIYGRVIDEGYFKILNNKIKEYKIENQVSFISDCNEVQQELYQFKYALHTSFKETGPLVLIEYLAQSLPFLSFETGQVYTSMGSKIPQFFINNFAVDNWVKKIEEISAVSQKTIKAVYENNFSSEKYIDKCLKIYQDIQNS